MSFLNAPSCNHQGTSHVFPWNGSDVRMQEGQKQGGAEAEETVKTRQPLHSFPTYMGQSLEGRDPFMHGKQMGVVDDENDVRLAVSNEIDEKQPGCSGQMPAAGDMLTLDDMVEYPLSGKVKGLGTFYILIDRHSRKRTRGFTGLCRSQKAAIVRQAYSVIEEVCEAFCPGEKMELFDAIAKIHPTFRRRYIRKLVETGVGSTILRKNDLSTSINGSPTPFLTMLQKGSPSMYDVKVLKSGTGGTTKEEILASYNKTICMQPPSTATMADYNGPEPLRAQVTMPRMASLPYSNPSFSNCRLPSALSSNPQSSLGHFMMDSFASAPSSTASNALPHAQGSGHGTDPSRGGLHPLSKLTANTLPGLSGQSDLDRKLQEQQAQYKQHHVFGHVEASSAHESLPLSGDDNKASTNKDEAASGSPLHFSYTASGSGEPVFRDNNHHRSNMSTASSSSSSSSIDNHVLLQAQGGGHGPGASRGGLDLLSKLAATTLPGLQRQSVSEQLYEQQPHQKHQEEVGLFCLLEKLQQEQQQQQQQQQQQEEEATGCNNKY